MQVVIAYHLKMTERGEVEADPLKQIVLVHIPDADATTNQPFQIPVTNQKPVTMKGLWILVSCNNLLILLFH